MKEGSVCTTARVRPILKGVRRLKNRFGFRFLKPNRPTFRKTDFSYNRGFSVNRINVLKTDIILPKAGNSIYFYYSAT